MGRVLFLANYCPQKRLPGTEDDKSLWKRPPWVLGWDLGSKGGVSISHMKEHPQRR